jgi:hypothetical protein
MNRQEFFNLIVETAVNHYRTAKVADVTNAGADFCVVTNNGVLKYVSLNQEVMNKVFDKFVSKEVTGGYDFRPFLIPNDKFAGVIFVQEISGDCSYSEHTIGGLDTLELLVDTNDLNKYVVINEGDVVENTAEMDFQLLEDKSVFEYQDTVFEIIF